MSQVPKVNDLAFTRLKIKNAELKNKSHFTFVFLGDTRGDAKAPINKKIFGEILNQINKLKEIPTFILHGGDAAYQGTIDNLKEFRRIIFNLPISKQKKLPFFVIPGNHEAFQPNPQNNQWDLKNYHQIIGADRFSIPVPSFTFRILAENNVSDLPPLNVRTPHYGFKQSTLNTIETIVRKSPGRSIITLHAPPGITCWKQHGMGSIQTNLFINGVVKKHSNKIPLILTSHIHGYDKFKQAKATYVLSGGGGANNLPLPSCVQKVFNFVVFKVGKNNITATVYKRNNKTGKWIASKLILKIQ